MSDCEPLCGHWGTSLGPLQEQSVLLTMLCFFSGSSFLFQCLQREGALSLEDATQQVACSHTLQVC